MPVPSPDAGSRWRCHGCGNLTRFDVVRTVRVREFWHVDLAGERTGDRPGDASVDDSEVLAEDVESVSCRWCGRSDAIEVVPRPAGGDPAGG